MTSGMDHKKQHKLYSRGAALSASVVLVMVILGTLVIYNVLYPRGMGLSQPIPFSHRVHAHTKQISCLMCHSQVATSARAGIPPLQTCLLCHLRIIRTFPYIKQLREHYRDNKPIVWKRVNWVPEFVYFNHSMHIRKGIDCSKCHGNVALMDRVVPQQKFKMGFCIQCHRDENATHDCFGCHR